MPLYLLFNLNGARYGVEVLSVLEIVWLPELTPAEEAPPYIAGVINLRGRIAPVMDLGLRLGHPPRCLQLGDSVMLLQTDGVTMGVIVDEVSDVIAIPAAAIEPPPHYDGNTPAHVHFIAGNARVGEEIVMLLDVQRLIHAPQMDSPREYPARPPASCISANAGLYFCPDATDEERAVLRARAHTASVMRYRSSMCSSPVRFRCVRSTPWRGGRRYPSMGKPFPYPGSMNCWRLRLPERGRRNPPAIRKPLWLAWCSAWAKSVLP